MRPVVFRATDYEENQRRLEENRRRAAEAEEARAAAEAKAQALLREHLTDKQRKALDKHGWFLVEGGKSKKTYQISGRTYAGNIIELDGRRQIAKYCVHASGAVPLADHLLAQLLHLKYDEEHLLAKANRTILAA